ncbi:hypothetical protein [Phytoactinopolyspora limicola]|uniref:hypothetical protein n=1 Tax=Phytoactinopolyspora limicola TaxID=2715536 RepID=UPI001408CD57|nr:hypothetical protein [Phytoactinopolyspora limicola]
MTDSFDAHLGRRLNALDSDIADVQMAGPAAARHRATQRTRNHITAGVVAGVAVFAVGFAVVAQPMTPADPDPIARPDPATPSPVETPELNVAEDLGPALMTVDDIAGDATLAWAESDADVPLVQCVPDLDIFAVADHAGVDFVAAETHNVSHDLLRAPSATAAEDLFDQIRSQIQSCSPSDQTEPTWVFNMGDLTDIGHEAWLISYWTDPADQQAPTPTIGLVRYDDVVSVTVLVEPTMSNDGSVDIRTPANAAERMCTVLFGTSCVGEPEFDDGVDTEPGMEDPQQSDADADADNGRPDLGADAGVGGDGAGDEGTVDPGGADSGGEPTGEPPALLDLADVPFLTDEDVNPVGSYSGFSRIDGYDHPDPYDHRCLIDLDATGADPMVKGHWTHGGEGSIDQFILRLPDVDSAGRIVTDHTVLPDQCGEIGDTRQQTVHAPTVIAVEGADAALVWTVDDVPLPEDPGSAPSFSGVGVAQVANVVVVIAFGAFGDPTEGDWNTYAAQVLEHAINRATR